MRSGKKGFTLIEAVMVAMIVAILAAFLFPTVRSQLTKADRAKASGLMRGMGNAMRLYSAEHNGYLPGPLWPGQVAEFDPARDGRLVGILAPYLGIEPRDQPFVIGKLFTTSFRRATQGIAPKDVRLYVMNMNLGGEGINPWGSLATTPTSGPLKMSALPANLPTRAWAMVEADQEQEDVAGAPWRSSTPAKPVYGDGRLYLFFDGRVEFLGLGSK